MDYVPADRLKDNVLDKFTSYAIRTHSRITDRIFLTQWHAVRCRLIHFSRRNRHGNDSAHLQPSSARALLCSKCTAIVCMHCSML